MDEVGVPTPDDPAEADKPIAQKLKFFRRRHSERMPNETVWKAPPSDQDEKPVRDEL